ncbi:hypothetical protein [Dictyobacter aurantiacus]|uniref:Bacterial toxin 44 domain-containing protein n=1 Tax=Dictyobacter aurantiacus TaxID=1936993 RepID=A0A401Z7F0_9CHLR|nr:hypothetical protein [Dictyobacter aurantiacus]GCE02765.1 hypothetical protein KDAU_00940 [Dictyobacter aurantiacus]
MIRKVVFRARFFLFSCLLAISAIGLSIVISHSTAKAATPGAVIYSRCNFTGKHLTGKHCTRQGGLYYVHNGVILGVTKGNRIHFRHFGKSWPNKDDWFICGKSRAEQAALDYQKGKKSQEKCAGDWNDGSWKPWVWETYHPSYAGIAFGYHLNGNGTHNGGFTNFYNKKKGTWSNKLKDAHGQGILYYDHYVNPTKNPSSNQGYSVKAFKHQSTSREGTITTKPLP